MKTDPKGSENGPHYYNYKPNFDPEKDTVTASEGSSPGGEVVSPPPAPEPPERPREVQETRIAAKARTEPRTDSGAVLKLSPDELLRLAPRLKTYLATPSPAWPDMVEAADWLRHDLGVSKPLWGEACLAMGREQAAIAVAIVSAKPAAHFTSSPAGYFHGMVAKAKAGQLNLARTIWGMRDNSKSGDRAGQAAVARGRGRSFSAVLQDRIDSGER